MVRGFGKVSVVFGDIVVFIVNFVVWFIRREVRGVFGDL